MESLSLKIMRTFFLILSSFWSKFSDKIFYHRKNSYSKIQFFLFCCLENSYCSSKQQYSKISIRVSHGMCVYTRTRSILCKWVHVKNEFYLLKIWTQCPRVCLYGLAIRKLCMDQNIGQLIFLQS